ncbi:MAG: hypothetical protein J7K78_02295, partial [Thaumarchaeota archaeon]|nr:hypothetical protein [Nitrososphaerota archaeon]
ILGFTPLSFEKIIEIVKPDLVVFGYDQSDLMESFLKFIKDRGLKIEVARVGKYSSSEPCSTSELIDRAMRILKPRASSESDMLG